MLSMRAAHGIPEVNRRASDQSCSMYTRSGGGRLIMPANIEGVLC